MAVVQKNDSVVETLELLHTLRVRSRAGDYQEYVAVTRSVLRHVPNIVIVSDVNND